MIDHRAHTPPKPGHPDTSNLHTIVGRRDEDPHPAARGLLGFEIVESNSVPENTILVRAAPCCDWHPPGTPICVNSMAEIYELQKQERKRMNETALPTDSDERKNMPMATGVLDYFPAAIADVARLSKVGNDKHNPGEPLHWARGKSMDHADTIMRHLAERGTIDTDGVRHSTKVAWRALAQLQQELEDAGLAPMSRGSRIAE